MNTQIPCGEHCPKLCDKCLPSKFSGADSNSRTRMIVRLWRYLCHHVLGTNVALLSIRTTFTLPLIVDPSWGVVNVTKIVLLSIRHAISFISKFLIYNWFAKVPQGDYFCISFHWKDLGVWSDHCSSLSFGFQMI